MTPTPAANYGLAGAPGHSTFWQDLVGHTHCYSDAIVSKTFLLPVGPALIDCVARYLLEPRKREATALELAARGTDLDSATAVQHAAAIGARLDVAVRLRARALATGDSSDAVDYGRRLWNEIAWLAATPGIAYGQGAEHSLGWLAHPERFTFAELPRSVRHLSRAVRYLLRSTSTIAPDLALPGWEAALPAWGGSGLASGCIPAEFTDWFSLLLRGNRFPLEPLAREVFGDLEIGSWRDSALCAVLAAHSARAHLFEVDASVLRAHCFSSRAPAVARVA
jgi:hypothetical protein